MDKGSFAAGLADKANSLYPGPYSQSQKMVADLAGKANNLYSDPCPKSQEMDKALNDALLSTS